MIGLNLLFFLVSQFYTKSIFPYNIKLVVIFGDRIYLIWLKLDSQWPLIEQESKYGGYRVVVLLSA